MCSFRQGTFKSYWLLNILDREPLTLLPPSNIIKVLTFG